MHVSCRTYTVRTNVRMAGKTPPSKGVSLGPTIKASQVKKSDSEMGPLRVAWRGKVAHPVQRHIESTRPMNVNNTGSKHPIRCACKMTISRPPIEYSSGQMVYSMIRHTLRGKLLVLGHETAQSGRVVSS